MAEGPEGIAKDRFTSLDALALVRELRSIPKARVDKVFDLPTGGYAVSLRVPGTGRRELHLVPGRYAALVATGEHSEELSPFAKEMRRLLTGARLDEIAEPRGERYLELTLQAGAAEAPIVLAVELFGTGNLAIASGGTIRAVRHARTWAHRTVRIGAPYERPPSRSDPWVMPASAIEAALLASRTDRATTLAARLAMGGPIAEEILARAGLPGSVSAPTDAAGSAPAVRSAIDELLEEIGDAPKGYLYQRGDLAIDATPYPSRRYRGEPGVAETVVGTFSEAAARFFPTVGPSLPRPPTDADRARAELLRQTTQQRAAIESLTEEAGRFRDDAERLLARYAEAEALRDEAIRGDPSSKLPVEIELDGRTISVRRKGPIRRSAQELFDLAKEAKGRADGARLALSETERRLAELAAAIPRPIEPAPTSARSPAAAKWFERYRWFVSSEGVLVLGGRDARSNEAVVRRYLGDRDLYVHADIHGAASVVVKQPPPGRPPAGPTTMEEAAQWAVAFSKAWRAGLASASAFWVTADQVAKGAESGEFVARGSFVIRGGRHVLKDLPTELAIGTVVYEGRELWEVAPLRAFGEGRARFLLTPGEERERADREIELSRELGLPRDRLQSLLPAGGISVRRA